MTISEQEVVIGTTKETERNDSLDRIQTVNLGRSGIQIRTSSQSILVDLVGRGLKYHK